MYDGRLARTVAGDAMSTIFDRIQQAGIVPVVVIDDPADAPALVGALTDGGLPVAEITFRTDAAEDAIRSAAVAHPDALVGAGSVVTPEQVDRAVAAGASFVVSPGLVENVVERTQARGAEALPGCVTPSDLMRARQLGLDVVKFFPAEMSGGLAMIKAIAAPFPGLRFIPTGGIDLSNIEEYLAEPRIVAVGGSWMVPVASIRARDWPAITAATRQAVAAVHRARGHA
jgi:2-dehydro-3-deoxyphosphogluconate aldolase / (4S)-4-hydroxy-2-oxoglutarate aldolase